MIPTKTILIALILTVVLNAPLFAADPNAKVTYDPVQDLYIIQYSLVDGGIHTTELELPNKVIPMVKAEVSVDKTTPKMIYHYKVINSENSPQNLMDFSVPVYKLFVFAMTPSGWNGGEYKGKSLFHWFWSVRQHFPPESTIRVRAIGLKPGEEQEGFSFGSEGLPGIVTAYFEGKSRILPSWEGETPPEIEAELDKLIVFPNGTVQRKTIGPVAPLVSLVSLDFLAYLIDLKDQAQTLGWIGGPKLVLELDKALDQIKEKLTADQMEPARGELGSFIEKVEAYYKETKEHETEKIKEQKKVSKEPEEKKFVTSEGYALLKFNAEYLKDQLGKPKEAEEKKHEDKKEEPKR